MVQGDSTLFDTLHRDVQFAYQHKFEHDRSIHRTMKRISIATTSD